MKKIALVALVFAGSAFAADVYVHPHITSNGTYVGGYYRTAPDSNPYNNYSTQGNVNPYTGQAGTVNPYLTPQPSPHSQYRPTYPAQVPQPTYQPYQHQMQPPTVTKTCTAYGCF